LETPDGAEAHSHRHLDGSAIEGDGGTVSFSIDGANYEIDLLAENAATLRGVFEKYVSAGRRVRRDSNASSSSSTRGTSAPERLKAIREWAAENGHEVSPRGRISAQVVEAYDSAH
jgi:hypothetical protein